MSGVFLGTSEFAATVLEILAGSGQRPELVVTLPDRRKGRGRQEQASPVADTATELGIDVLKSGTRKDELITPKEHLQKMYVLRRILSPMGTQDAIEFLLDKLKSSKNNDDFFQSMNT